MLVRTLHLPRAGRLVAQANCVEPAILGDVPTAVAEVVNGVAAHLAPATVLLANHVHARRLIVSRLEVVSLGI